MSERLALGVGDILCTRSNRGWAGWLIRFGAALRDQPNTVNHVIVVHHQDEAGVWWGIEGRPGGVGWVTLRKALKAPYTINNARQPKTPDQRQAIAKVSEGLLGTPYDWVGIIQDGMEAIGAQRLWRTRIDGEVPAQVVCSSLADWIYDQVGLDSPGRRFDRTVTPGDWATLITERRWHERKPHPHTRSQA